MSNGFDALLDGALSGRPTTNLGITLGPAVSGMFEQHQQGLIAQGIDKAAAVGVENALILHEQHALRVDVRNRVVLEAIPLNDQEVIDGIEGIVPLQPDANTEDTEDQQSPQIERFTPARVVRNASLVHALAGRVPD